MELDEPAPLRGRASVGRSSRDKPIDQRYHYAAAAAYASGAAAAVAAPRPHAAAPSTYSAVCMAAVAAAAVCLALYGRRGAAASAACAAGVLTLHMLYDALHEDADPLGLFVFCSVAVFGVHSALTGVSGTAYLYATATAFALHAGVLMLVKPEDGGVGDASAAGGFVAVAAISTFMLARGNCPRPVHFGTGLVLPAKMLVDAVYRVPLLPMPFALLFGGLLLFGFCWSTLLQPWYDAIQKAHDNQLRLRKVNSQQLKRDVPARNRRSRMASGD